MAELARHHDIFIGRFSAMASPCELLIETVDEDLARRCLAIAESEARRIEHKFSRYLDNNIVCQINNAGTSVITVDSETAALLDYADQCFQLSEGLFDITSGVLRRAWRFDGTGTVPLQSQLDELLPQVGWNRVNWNAPEIQVPEGMELDLGGMGKEYAVDRVTALLRQHAVGTSIVVNFGGDLAITSKPLNRPGWRIGIADPCPDHSEPAQSATEPATTEIIELANGAMTTSGDAHRYIMHKGVRYGHILDPRTGWPAANAPTSVTVLADTCLEAGILSTLAILKGAAAENFLAENNARYWVTRNN